MANADKQSQLENITSFLDKAESFTLLKFEKTTHIALEGLRKELKKNKAKVMVVKNTILQKAINKLAANKDKAYLRDLQKKTKNIRENTAILSFGEDWGAAMNAFFKFSKENKTIGFKVGMLDKTTYGEQDLMRIAQLPGRDVLVGKMLGSMKSPVAHFTNAIKFNMQKLVYVLNAKSKQAT